MTMVQANADASLLSGNGNPTTVRQAILGFNSGRNLLQDPTVKVGSSAVPFLNEFKSATSECILLCISCMLCILSPVLH